MLSSKITYRHKQNGPEHSIRVKTGIEEIRRVLKHYSKSCGPNVKSIQVWIMPVTEKRSRQIPMFGVKLEDGTEWNCHQGFVKRKILPLNQAVSVVMPVVKAQPEFFNQDGSVNKRGFAAGLFEPTDRDGVSVNIYFLMAGGKGGYFVSGTVADRGGNDHKIEESFSSAGSARTYVIGLVKSQTSE